MPFLGFNTTPWRCTILVWQILIAKCPFMQEQTRAIMASCLLKLVRSGKMVYSTPVFSWKD